MDLHLDLARDRPLRVQLEQALRDGIRRGRLLAGSALPSTRALARTLGISRGVVVEAYSQLIAEGYLTARQGAATRVAAGVVAPVDASSPPPEPPARFDMRTLPDLGAFPRRAWARATGEVLRTLPQDGLSYGRPEGSLELRDALAGYLGRTRGVVADADHLVVTAGVTDGLVTLWRALVAGGARRVAIERPGWRGQRQTVEVAGLEPVPVPVDGDGLVAGELRGSRADAVVVSPAHQFPTGAVLSSHRRRQIAEWARATGALVVEDDYDAQYRYDREPVGAVQGVAPDCTVHAGSVSKVLAPALRVGWLLLPGSLVEPVSSLMCAGHGWRAGIVDQLALARLIETGELDRHLRLTRRLYRRRRELLLEVLDATLPELRVSGATAGLHVVLRLPDGADPVAVAAAARERGLAVQPLEEGDPALVIGYGSLPEPAIVPAVRTLGDAIERA